MAAHRDRQTDSRTSAITVTLGDGTRLETDHVLLATGYQVDMRRVPYSPKIAVADGFPAAR